MTIPQEFFWKEAETLVLARVSNIVHDLNFSLQPFIDMEN